HLSRGAYAADRHYDYVTPQKIVDLAMNHGCHSVAFTYNEPTVFAEYAIDIATIARREKLGTVLVSNGYITLTAARELYPLITAANIDMKGFSEHFYGKMTRSQLQPVLDAIKYYYSLGGHLELTNLVIPGQNDDEAMITTYLDWVERELSRDVPLHFSAYHPDYRYRNSPPTDVSTLLRIRDQARRRGFHHIYLGNVFVPD
ncbi:MAG: radical SAM protein, partial [Victivallales bacterium]|nr:radical SAM protein [Victivallales bacterium]